LRDGRYDEGSSIARNANRFKSWMTGHAVYADLANNVDVFPGVGTASKIAVVLLLAKYGRSSWGQVLLESMDLDVEITWCVLDNLNPNAEECALFFERVVSGGAEIPAEWSVISLFASQITERLFKDDLSRALELAPRIIEFEQARASGNVDMEARLDSSILDLLATVVQYDRAAVNALAERYPFKVANFEQMLECFYTPAQQYPRGSRSGLTTGDLEGLTYLNRWQPGKLVADDETPLIRTAVDVLAEIARIDPETRCLWRARALLDHTRDLLRDVSNDVAIASTPPGGAVRAVLEEAIRFLEGAGSRRELEIVACRERVLRPSDAADFITNGDRLHIRGTIERLRGLKSFANNVLDAWRPEVPVTNPEKFHRELVGQLQRLFRLAFEAADDERLPLWRRKLARPETDNEESADTPPARIGQRRPSPIETEPMTPDAREIGRVIGPLPAVHRHLLTSLRGRYRDGAYAHPVVDSSRLQSELRAMERRIKGPFDTLTIELTTGSHLESIPYLACARRAPNAAESALL
jgi:hypothetical protein